MRSPPDKLVPHPETGIMTPCWTRASAAKILQVSPQMLKELGRTEYVPAGIYGRYRGGELWSLHQISLVGAILRAWRACKTKRDRFSDQRFRAQIVRAKKEWNDEGQRNRDGNHRGSLWSIRQQLGEDRSAERHAAG